MNYPNYISIGVDPGSSSGAVAIIIDGILYVHGIGGRTEQQIEGIFSSLLLDKGMQTEVFAIIERVNAMPGQGVSSSFKFGISYGFLRCCLVANKIPFRDYLPREWQKQFSMVKKKGEADRAWKERLLNVAQNLYPTVNIPLYAADAVLLSHIAKDFLTQKL